MPSQQAVDKLIGLLATTLAGLGILLVGSYVKNLVWETQQSVSQRRGCAEKQEGKTKTKTGNGARRDRRRRRVDDHSTCSDSFDDGEEDEMESSSKNSNGSNSSGRRERDGTHSDDDDTRVRNRSSSNSHVKEQESEDSYHSYVYGRRSSNSKKAVLVQHEGGCHCGSLRFEAEAPAHLAATEGAGKLRYPFITVPAERFHLTSDESSSTLYLLEHQGVYSASVFCRECGCHVVHAPYFPGSTIAHVNVHCIEASTIASLSVALVGADGLMLTPGKGRPVSMEEVYGDGSRSGDCGGGDDDGGNSKLAMWDRDAESRRRRFVNGRPDFNNYSAASSSDSTILAKTSYLDFPGHLSIFGSAHGTGQAALGRGGERDDFLDNDNSASSACSTTDVENVCCDDYGDDLHNVTDVHETENGERARAHSCASSLSNASFSLLKERGVGKEQPQQQYNGHHSDGGNGSGVDSGRKRGGYESRKKGVINGHKMGYSNNINSRGGGGGRGLGGGGYYAGKDISAHAWANLLMHAMDVPNPTGVTRGGRGGKGAGAGGAQHRNSHNVVTPTPTRSVKHPSTPSPRFSPGVKAWDNGEEEDHRVVYDDDDNDVDGNEGGEYEEYVEGRRKASFHNEIEVGV